MEPIGEFRCFVVALSPVSPCPAVWFVNLGVFWSTGLCTLELARLCWAGFTQEMSGEAARCVGFSGEMDELHCAVIGNCSSDIPISLSTCLARGQNQFGTRRGWVVFCVLIHHTGTRLSQEHKTLPKADTPVLLPRPLGLSPPWAPSSICPLVQGGLSVAVCS